MAIYRVDLSPPIIITPEHHIISLRLYQRIQVKDGFSWIAVGTATFEKTPQETWATTGARLKDYLHDWFARFEAESQLAQAVQTWLNTQTWET